MNSYIFTSGSLKKTVTKEDLLATFPEADGVIEYPHTLNWNKDSHIVCTEDKPYKKGRYILLPVLKHGLKNEIPAEVNENAFLIEITDTKRLKWRELSIDHKIMLTKSYKHIKDEFSAANQVVEFSMKLKKPLFIDLEEIIEMETENLINEIDHLYGISDNIDSYLEFIDRPIGEALASNPESIIHKKTTPPRKDTPKRIIRS